MTLLSFVTLFFLCITVLQIDGTQTFWPAAIPLAVRTPYLSAWMSMQNGSESSNQWPTFWNGATLGWICYIRVDGETYSLFGENNVALTGNYSVTPGSILETELTPTRTTQVIKAGNIHVNLTFLSPIEPSDPVLQSLPFADMAVNFTSTDGKQYDIQLYSSITGEWLYGGDMSQRSTKKIKWDTTNTSSMIYHQIELETSSAFQEFEGQAIDGTAFHAMALEQGRNITWQTCIDSNCRSEFIYSGGFNSKNDNNTFREITNDWPVFPISIDLGNVTSSNAPIVWVVGYARDPNINYTLSDQSVSLRPYYTTQYNTTQDALEFFVADYDNALSRAMALDELVREAASGISANGTLYNMLSLATRQAFGSLEITAPLAVGGQSNPQARIFMKDIGFSQRVTPVEALYAALPMYLYYNASQSLLKPLIVPLLEQQNSTGSFTYAARDIGTSYPEVTGATLVNEEPESVEQTANMLIITLAHVQYSNSTDTSLIHEYYNLLDDWAQYLKANRALYPANQISIDDESTISNSSNLAVKGILAIQAMAEISRLVGATSDSQQYSAAASSFMNTWQTLALSSGDNPSVLPSYNSSDQESWCLPYNLYIQTLFGFNLLNETLLEKLTTAYAQRLQPSSGYHTQYGLPIDSTSGSYGNAAWNAFMAATVTDDTVRTQMLDAIWNYASDNTTGTPFGSEYDVESGQYHNGTSSPALGGLFAPFIHSGSVDVQPEGDGSSSHSVDVGAIAGGVVGGFVGLLALVGVVLWLLNRRRKIRKAAYLLDVTGTRTEPTPFEPSIAQRRASFLPSERSGREKLSTREGVPLLPSTGSSSTAAGCGPTSTTPAIPSSTGTGDSHLQQDELFGLRSEIEDLRRVVNVHLEGREPSDLGAPPEYS